MDIRDKDESNSISNQRELIYDYIRRDKKLRKLEVIELKDDGYSGKNLNRPGIQQLLELVRKQQVSCIIVKDALHFSRNFAGAKRLHAKNGCRHAGFVSAAGLYHRHLHHAPVFPGNQGGVRAYPGGGKAAKHSPVRNAGIHGRTDHDVGGHHFGRNCCGSCRKRHRKPMQKDELYPDSYHRFRLAHHGAGNTLHGHNYMDGVSAMIRFQNVSATIQGNRILDNINLAINGGEFVLLCGESGCGKTTLTRLVNGLIPHFVKGVKVDGAVTVEALDIAESPMYKIAESVGSVFQNPKTQFFNTDSSAEIAFGLENIGADRDSMHKRVAKTISDLEIETLANRSIFSMSGGEKQLLAFASVYAMNPQVYVLDEPSANLDHEAMGKLRRILEIVKKSGHTVLIAEHRLSYLSGLADRIVYLKAGRIEREFTAAEFADLPESERSAMGLRSIRSEEIKIPERTFMQPNPSLAVCHLSVKRKKQPILHDFSFSANAGDIIGIVGKNGSGKSTLCSSLCGLLPTASGEVIFRGEKLSRSARTKQFGMVMQDVNHQLFSDSVKNECLSANPNATNQEIETLLNSFDLLDCIDRHPLTLSGGQRQRLAICQAIMGKKKFLIFDEPTSGLDFRHMCQVTERLKQLAQHGYILFVITHDYEFLNRACNCYVRIDKIN